VRALARALEALARGSVRRPWTVLAVALAVAATAVAWAVPHLALRTSNLDLVDPDLAPVRHFRELAREFGTPNVLVVVLAGQDGAALRAAVDRLEPRLAEVPGVRSVLGRLPLPPELAGGVPGPFSAPAAAIEPYLVSRDGGLYFLFVQPQDLESRAQTIAPLVAGVRRAIAGADLQAAGVTAGLTGLPQYAVDDQEAVERDLRLLSPVSFVLVLALFGGAFAALRRPLAAMAALVLAVAVTLGLAALWPGHLTLLSASFGSILFGLGVDFGIHLVDRIEAARAGADGEAEAVVAAVEGLAPALATSALTTASAFFTLTLSGFRGFAELGWIAGVGVLVSLVATVTVLPALLVLRPGPPPRPGVRRRNRIGATLVRLQSPRLALALALLAVAAPLALRPRFDSDYLDLQPRGSEAVRWEREMVARSAYSPQAAVFVADSRREAAELVARLRADETVGEVHWAGELPLLDTRSGAKSGAPSGPGRALAARFVSPAGRYAVYAHPRGDVWDPEVRDAFLDRMAALDPEVTGMPILGRFMIDRSRRALERGALLAAIAVFAWVLADLRDPRLTLLALLPTALGMAGLVALMGLFGVAFNPLSVLALPVVIGIAVDDGVHLAHRFRAESGDVERALSGTGRAIVLTSATSLAAFGSLAAASHRGLASFALVLSFGVASALAASVLVLPQALGRFVPRATAGPQPAVTSGPPPDSPPPRRRP
jgi:hypothetical protein